MPPDASKIIKGKIIEVVLAHCPEFTRISRMTGANVKGSDRTMGVI